MGYLDAHNHLQDDRFAGRQGEIVEECRRAGVQRMVVNGSCEEDWPAVAELAQRFPDVVVPAFGLHPWHVHGRTPAWMDVLRRHLDATPGAVVGEIGLDRWILECPVADRVGLAGHAGEWTPAPLAEQEETFAAQLALAAERGVSASIHCLQAWGRMHDLLRHAARPACGFLLHSYGGSRDLVRPLAALGAFFGFPGYFLHARKARQRAAFQVVPWDRLLVETDAPDQVLPTVAEWRVTDCEGAGVGSGPAVGGWRPVALRTDGGTVLNHPGNAEWVYRGLAEVRGVGVEELIGQVAVGFARLFGAQEWG